MLILAGVEMDVCPIAASPDHDFAECLSEASLVVDVRTFQRDISNDELGAADVGDDSGADLVIEVCLVKANGLKSAICQGARDVVMCGVSSSAKDIAMKPSPGTPVTGSIVLQPFDVRRNAVPPAVSSIRPSPLRISRMPPTSW